MLLFELWQTEQLRALNFSSFLDQERYHDTIHIILHLFIYMLHLKWLLSLLSQIFQGHPDLSLYCTKWLCSIQIKTYIISDKALFIRRGEEECILCIRDCRTTPPPCCHCHCQRAKKKRKLIPLQYSVSVVSVLQQASSKISKDALQEENWSPYCHKITFRPRSFLFILVSLF